MQFHNYNGIWSTLKRQDKSLRKEDPAKYLSDIVRKYARIARNHPENESLHHQAHCSSIEAMWFGMERPYYNVWPCVRDMLLDTSLDLPISGLVFPYPSILMRMPMGLGTRIRTILAGIYVRGDGGGDVTKIKNSGMSIRWVGVSSDVTRRFTFIVEILDDNGKLATIQEFFDAKEGTTINALHSEIGREFKHYGNSVKLSMKQFDEIIVEAMRIACGVAILANSGTFIQPVILNKDILQYENADEATKAVIEKRAQREGKGFQVGKELQKQLDEERQVSPHIRKPHLCTFWTGKGRSTPVLKLRRGAVIQPGKVTDVPTGFLDREVVEEINQ